MRVPNVPLFVTMWEAVGAKPTTMAFSEVFTSLQQRTIKAQENPLDLIQSTSFFEVQKYVNETEHVRGWLGVWIGEKQFDSLPKEYQDILFSAGKKAQAYYDTLLNEPYEKIKTQLKKEGMTFVTVDQKKFRDKAVPAVLKSLTPEQRELYQEMQLID